MHNGLHESKYGWHKFSNLVFTDWPYGTGFSKSKNPNYKPKPQDFAKNATKFIKRWTERYSDFKGDIYIAGDSASGLWVPLIAQHALKDFKINDKELAGRFKGIVIEGPFMTVKYGFRDGVVLSDTLFHNVPKKNAKKFMKKIQETNNNSTRKKPKTPFRIFFSLSRQCISFFRFFLPTFFFFFRIQCSYKYMYIRFDLYIYLTTTFLLIG